MSWFQRYPLQAEESGGADAGAGGVSPSPSAGEGSPASQEPALSPLHWSAPLTEEYQALPIVKEAKTLNDFVKNAHNTKTFVGESIQLPKGYDPGKGPADGVDLSKVLDKLGRPEKPGDYTIDYGELPEGLAINQAEQGQFRDVAHKLGLAPWQVSGLVQYDKSRQIAALNKQAGERATEVATGTAKLHELHGANTPTVQAAARHTYEIMGQGPFGTPEMTEEIVTLLSEKGLLNHPTWVTGMANWAEQTRGSRFLGANQPIHGAEGLPDVNAKLAVLNDKAFANGGRLTQAEEAEVDRLYELKARYQAA